MPIEPVFPQEFVQKHCPKVQSARRMLKRIGENPKDCVDFAECEFVERGCGIKCQSCEKFVSPVGSTDKADEFYRPILDYYRDIDEFERRNPPADKIRGAYI